ncbi:MAG: hypothetical protein ACRDRL_14635 [Sciscionella sp.]
MTREAAPDGSPTVYAEPGSSWWPLLWGPAFALVGALVEVGTGPVHVLGWVIVGIGLAAVTAVWVIARRRNCAVTLTPTELIQGEETLPLDRVAGLSEVEVAYGMRVLGGGYSVPKRYHPVALLLTDDTTAVAWARDAEALRAALRARIPA